MTILCCLKVENAGHFYAHIQPLQSELYKIHSILRKPSSLVDISADVVFGFTYAAPYREREEEDFIYYRAQVKKKYCVQNTVWVDVSVL